MKRPKLLPTGRHPLPPGWQIREVRIDLVGCGGTGAQLATKLARLHVALKALGHPHGLFVRVWDPDTVSEANVGRQLYSQSDIGLPKASVLLHRLNAWFGLDWKATQAIYSGNSNPFEQTDLVITCVDTARARREIGARLSRTPFYRSETHWLDCGNAQATGQVFLTQNNPLVQDATKGDPLPLLRDVLPELFDETLPEDNRPSCSLAESLEAQGLFINDEVATWAARLLEMWFRQGHLDVHGYWINQEAGLVRAVPVPAAPKKRRRSAK